MALMGVLPAVGEIRVQKRRHGSFRVVRACPSPTPSRPPGRGPGLPLASFWQRPYNVTGCFANSALPLCSTSPPRSPPSGNARPQDGMTPRSRSSSEEGADRKPHGSKPTRCRHQQRPPGRWARVERAELPRAGAGAGTGPWRSVRCPSGRRHGWRPPRRAAWTGPK